jgi:hypothetical protein
VQEKLAFILFSLHKEKFLIYTKTMEYMHTKVIVHLSSQDAPPYIRGEGPDLSWDRGVPLKQLSEGEWFWESEKPFEAGSFKVVLDDKLYELGENHPLLPGSSTRINPKFPSQIV